MAPSTTAPGKCSEIERPPGLGEDQCCQLYPDACVVALHKERPIKDGKCGEIERPPELSEKECCEQNPDDCEMVENKVRVIVEYILLSEFRIYVGLSHSVAMR